MITIWVSTVPDCGTMHTRMSGWDGGHPDSGAVDGAVIAIWVSAVPDCGTVDARKPGWDGGHPDWEAARGAPERIVAESPARIRHNGGAWAQ